MVEAKMPALSCIRHRLPGVCAILSAAMLSGCAGTSTSSVVATPAVDLISVEMGAMSFAGQTFLLGFSVSNPNPFPLPVEGVRYNVRLNDRNFAGGESRGDFTVPAHGDGNFVISVDLDLLRSGSQLTTVLRSGLEDSVDYELHGDLALDIPASPSLRFSNRGTILVQTRGN